MKSLALKMEMEHLPTVPWSGSRQQSMRLGFVLFMLLNALLFVRPSDLVPALATVPLYEVAALACVAACALAAVQQLRLRSLAARPLTACVVGMLAAVILSQLSNLAPAKALSSGLMFAKVVVYYLLLMAVITSPGRMRVFLRWLVVLLLITAILPLLQFRGLIDVPALSVLADRSTDTSTGQDLTFLRLRGAGIFNDPNDLCQIMDVGLLLSLWAMADSRRRLVKLAWLAGAVLFAYEIALTRSRGGFLALLAGLVVLLVAQWGWRKAAVLCAIVLPALFFLMGGRQTELSTESQTGQTRVQIWSDALAAFRNRPILGVGHGSFGVENGLVAHNSFLQCYADLGIVGGALFLGAFCLGLWMLTRLGSRRVQILDPQLARMRPYLLAALAAYAAAMLSLSRSYEVPTYLMLGLAGTLSAVVTTYPEAPTPRLDWPLVRRLGLVGLLYPVVAHVFVRLFVRW